MCSSAVLLHKGKIESNGIPKNVINEYSKIISGDKTKAQEREISKEKDKPISKKASNEVLRSELLNSEKENKSTSEEFNYGGNKAEIIEFSILNKEGFTQPKNIKELNKIKDMIEITKAQFNRYEGCRLSGATNMFDLTNVKMITGLNEEQIICKMENYNKLIKKYK